MSGRAIRRSTAVVALTTAVLFAQDHKAPAADSAAVPAGLRLRGDPAARFELGLRTAPPAPARVANGVVWSAGRCARCAHEERQVNALAPPSDARILGMPPDAASAWFERLSGTPPVIFWFRRTTLVCALSGPTQAKPSDDEWARLRVFFPALAPNTAKLDAHVAAHLWAERLVALEAAITDLLDRPSDDANRPAADVYATAPHDRAEIVLFSDEKSHEAFEAFLGSEPSRPRLDGRLFKGRPVVGLRIDGEDRHAVLRRFAYASTMSVLRSFARDERPSAAWIRCGIAHLFESLSAPRPALGEAASGTLPPDEHDARFKSPEDRSIATIQLVDEGKAPRLAALAHSDEAGLSPRSRMVASSLVRFLAGLDRRRFAVFWKRCTLQPVGPAPAAELSAALEAAFGSDTAVVENAWRVWVTGTKPK